jgi:hypothetical protein
LVLFDFTKSRVFTVLPTASQMNWSQLELSFARHYLSTHLSGVSYALADQT